MVLDPSLCLRADWPAPASVQTLITTRMGGVSRGPWASLNPAAHVQDSPADVAQNRQRIRETIGLDTDIQWLRQVHGVEVVTADSAQIEPEADACFSAEAGVACAVMTADCLPVLLCDSKGAEIAAVHCGWRGLAAGILERAIKRFESAPHNLMAWMGPAIGPTAFEVGRDVLAAFDQRAAEASWAASAGIAFTPSANNKYLADIYTLARLELNALGVTSIYGGGLCTVSDPLRYFSYRRDGVCGRMASLIWIKSSP